MTPPAPPASPTAAETERQICDILLDEGATRWELLLKLSPPVREVEKTLAAMVARGWAVRQGTSDGAPCYRRGPVTPPVVAEELTRQLYAALGEQELAADELAVALTPPEPEVRRALERMAARGWVRIRGPADLPRFFRRQEPAADASRLEFELYWALPRERLWSSERLAAMQRLPRDRLREFLRRMEPAGLVARAAELDRYVREAQAASPAAPPPLPSGLTAAEARLFALLGGERADFRVPEDPLAVGAVVGVGILEMLELNVGDTVCLTVQESSRESGKPLKTAEKTLVVLDTFETGNIIFDRGVLLDLDEAARLYRIAEGPGGKTGPAGAVTGISVWLRKGDDYAATEAFCRALRDPTKRDLTAAGLPLYEIRTWRDLQAEVFEMITIQNIAMQLILYLQLLSIFGFLFFMFWVMVTDRTRNIGVLRACGALRSGVAGIFLAAGFLLGAVATGAGVAAGLFLAEEHRLNWIVRRLPWLAESLNKLFMLKSLPSAVSERDVFWLVVITIGAAMLAAGCAAARAVRIHPAEALRYE